MTKPARMQQLLDAVRRLKPERSLLLSDLVAALTLAARLAANDQAAAAIATAS